VLLVSKGDGGRPSDFTQLQGSQVFAWLLLRSVANVRARNRLVPSVLNTDTATHRPSRVSPCALRGGRPGHRTDAVGRKPGRGLR
jgi:hypothetical protein